MNGKSTKYYFYDSNKQSMVLIPVSVAKSLNWKHKDEIKVIFDVKNDKKARKPYKPL